MWLMRKESDLDGYSSFFLILSLSDINSCAHHIVCGHGLQNSRKKTIKRKNMIKDQCVFKSHEDNI